MTKIFWCEHAHLIGTPVWRLATSPLALSVYQCPASTKLADLVVMITQFLFLLNKRLSKIKILCIYSWWSWISPGPHSGDPELKRTLKKGPKTHPRILSPTSQRCPRYPTIPNRQIRRLTNKHVKFPKKNHHVWNRLDHQQSHHGQQSHGQQAHLCRLKTGDVPVNLTRKIFFQKS